MNTNEKNTLEAPSTQSATHRPLMIGIGIALTLHLLSGVFLLLSL